MKLPSECPVAVKKGNITIRIYRAANVKNGTKYDEFKVVYYHGERKRKLKTFSDDLRALPPVGHARFLMVPTEGVEPTHSYEYQILSLAIIAYFQLVMTFWLLSG